MIQVKLDKQDDPIPDTLEQTDLNNNNDTVLSDQGHGWRYLFVYVSQPVRVVVHGGNTHK